MFLSACLLVTMPAAGFGQHATALATTTDGKLLFVAMNTGAVERGDNGFVCVWDLTKPELKAIVPATPSAVRAIQPTADGKRFTILGGDRWDVPRVQVFDTATKKLLHKIENPTKYGSHAAVSPDGNWVALRPITFRTDADKTEVRVWNTETGKRAEEVEKAAGKLAGTVAFTADSKLAVASREEYAEFDPATGKKTGGWKRAAPAGREFLEGGDSVAVLPNGKGVVTVAPTGKRRQSYVIRMITEKNDWFLGESWDFASAPVLSPDGKLLIVSAGRAREAGGTYALKLDDGGPEMTDQKDDEKGSFWGGERDKKRPNWRELAVGEATRAGRELPGAMAFAPDGKRLFVAGSLGKLQVHDTERRVPKATLFVAPPRKDDVPDWHIVTAGGEIVGSPAEVEALVKGGKVKDAAKVREALGVK